MKLVDAEFSTQRSPHLALIGLGAQRFPHLAPLSRSAERSALLGCFVYNVLSVRSVEGNYVLLSRAPGAFMQRTLYHHCSGFTGGEPIPEMSGAISMLLGACGVVCRLLRLA